MNLVTQLNVLRVCGLVVNSQLAIRVYCLQLLCLLLVSIAASVYNVSKCNKNFLVLYT